MKVLVDQIALRHRSTNSFRFADVNTGPEFGITPRRRHESLPAPRQSIARMEFLCLSSAGPPLLLRCSSVRHLLSTRFRPDPENFIFFGAFCNGVKELSKCVDGRTFALPEFEK